MQEKIKCLFPTSEQYNQYLALDDSIERVTLLAKWRTVGIKTPANFVKLLIELRMPEDEIIAAFELCETSDRFSLELWLTREFINWSQNIAAAALRCWARATDRILWHRLIPVVQISELPQRIRYTILELAPLSHGYEIIKSIAACPGWEDLSPAFHSLLLERAMQFEIKTERLLKLAWKIFDTCALNAHPDHKALFASQAFLIRHAADDLDSKLKNNNYIWSDFLNSALDDHAKRAAKFAKVEKSLAKAAGKTESVKNLPPTWSRFDAPLQVLQHYYATNAAEGILDGFQRSTIVSAIKISNFNQTWSDSIVSHLSFEEIQGLEIPLLGALSKSYNQPKFKALNEARKRASIGVLPLNHDEITSTIDFSEENISNNDSIDHPIKSLFEAMIAKASVAHQKPEAAASIWAELAASWGNSDATNLNSLSSLSRKHKGVAHIAFILFLSRLSGRDDAVLKLLDYIRSNDEDILRRVVKAFGQINTPRSHLELIGMLTRPNSSLVVQQEIVSILGKKDLSGLQKELRSAVHDLKAPQNTDYPLMQIKDELVSLIAPTSGDGGKPAATSVISMNTEEFNLDQELANMIPHFKNLSSEVKRALRTALFFNKTAATSVHANSIDLSPLIDMQYKAMELLYREFFEDMVSHSLQSGSIQRKLDVIGYARPIVRQMDDFEGYIASLPIVREIPFFSKFKLRKMLRAICQFEPGRRFTLDGLKAFGLYFFVFGRKQCKAGLAGIVDIGTSDDSELAEFCKELHIFQDFRNRAAHEGFHPDASNDIDGIWRTTAVIVQWAFKIRDAQKSARAISAKMAS